MAYSKARKGKGPFFKLFSENEDAERILREKNLAENDCVFTSIVLQ